VDTATGRVGVGTTNPQGKLQVHYTEGLLSDIDYYETSTWHNKGLALNGGNGGFLYGVDINHSIFLRQSPFSTNDHNAYCNFGYHAFYTGGLIENQTEKMRIANGGVDVTGTISATGSYLGGTSTDTARAFSHLSNMGNGTTKYITLGKSATTNNQGEISYHHVGDGSNNNYIGLSLFSKGLLYGTGNQNVGIGITNPDTKLHLKDPPSVSAYGSYRSYIHMEYGSGNWVMAVDNNTSINHNLYWYANLYPSGTIGKVITFENDQSKGTSINVNTFTGQHRNFIKGIQSIFSKDFLGMIVSSDNNTYIKLNGDICKGKNAITINEAVPFVSLSNVAYDKKCFGVISDAEDPNERVDTYGRITSHFIKEKGDTRIFINSLGEGAIWVVNTNGNMESGDYITTSNVAGYGMKQDDDILHNYTVAKITMDCDFNPPQQAVQIILKDAEGNNILDQYDQIQWVDDPDGATEPAYKTRQLEGGIIAAFVGCTYHCG